MKKLLLIFGIIIFVGGVFFYFNRGNEDYRDEKFVVPETVSLYMRTIDNDLREPVLDLEASTNTSVCDEVSNLEISESIKEGIMSIGIKRYSIREYNGGCIAVVLPNPSQVEIEIKDFLQNGGHQIWFTLDNKESRYSLTQDKSSIYLTPIEVTNVISQKEGIDFSEIPKSLRIDYIPT